jgi:CBS domain containing-hemolysin-like protein
LHVEDAGELLGFDIDSDSEGVDTVAGLIAKRLGKVALPGSSITIEGWVLTAEQAAGRRNRITTVLAEPLGQAQSEGEQEQTTSKPGGRTGSSGAPNGREEVAS